MTDSKIEEVLERDGVIMSMPVGTSMWPMLINRQDQMIIQKVDRPLKVNDVVLFKRDSGQYVLHRLVKFRRGGYVFRGDNQVVDEYGITDRHVLGILKGFYKGDEYIDCETNSRYRRYVFKTRLKYALTYPLRKVYRLARQIIGKLARKFGIHNK